VVGIVCCLLALTILILSIIKLRQNNTDPQQNDDNNIEMPPQSSSDYGALPVINAIGDYNSIPEPNKNAYGESSFSALE
jgi:hypothetical protein